MSFQSISPILPALNVKKSAEFYRDILGFEVTIYDEHNYAVMKRGSVGLHLWQTDDKNLCENSGCYIYVNDIEILYNELLPKGVIHPNGKLEVKPWGLKEFSVLDTDGNLLRIGEIIQ